MSPAKLHEKALFEAALDLTNPDERQAFLNSSCGEDTPLRVRLEKLLASQESAEAFLTLRPQHQSESTLSGGPAPRDDGGVLAETNVHIGRYKLVQRLGEGGCGVVYLAEQQEPVQRQVALKIIRMGIGTPNLIARFQREQQAMAWMDHPNIARVFDAGSTAAGRPYFVMELVRGTKITDYCNQHRLDVNRRLDLFVQVCNAVQHAHQKGIIHRDIKPSNILIALHDGLPVPKVIDFGISKSVEEALPEGAEASVRFIGTPDYMSPEQAEPEGRDVDTRSDIYGLGVLLYELLTGRTPFPSKQMAQSTPDELSRAIRERPAATPPSAYVASLDPADLARLAAQRGVSPWALISALHGDLDWIVLRALEKDRQCRYETANGLARDIRRHQDHEPVAAHPPSRFYHLRKLVRRNRQLFIAGTVLVATLVAGFGVSTRLYYREREAHREQARLRAEAEQSRAVELSLRQHAEAREKFAQAAVLLSHGDIAAADALIAELPLELTPPSLEAAAVLRRLGEWHAFAGRWQPAAKRFTEMASAITQVDSADTDEVSRQLLMAGAALCEAGDRDSYEQFRQMAIARFALSANPVVAEHTIKASLLIPSDAKTLRKLAPLAAVATATLEGTGPKNSRDPHMFAWRSFAIALFEYRQGRDGQAIVWVQRCEAYPNYNAARFASSRLIFAMACHHLHREDEARNTLKQVRELIDARFATALGTGNDHQELWFDWINARILLREASTQIDNVSPAPSPLN
ncbi:MAG: serine/threonine protein kinase [Verrucomicrobia bacterium]|nr:serine/threonine protein kinase [Verrucomicrobiota bacterium]